MEKLRKNVNQRDLEKKGVDEGGRQNKDWNCLGILCCVRLGARWSDGAHLLCSLQLVPGLWEHAAFGPVWTLWAQTTSLEANQRSPQFPGQAQAADALQCLWLLRGPLQECPAHGRFLPHEPRPESAAAQGQHQGCGRAGEPPGGQVRAVLSGASHPGQPLLLGQSRPQGTRVRLGRLFTSAWPLVPGATAEGTLRSSGGWPAAPATATIKVRRRSPRRTPATWGAGGGRLLESSGEEEQGGPGRLQPAAWEA